MIEPRRFDPFGFCSRIFHYYYYGNYEREVDNRFIRANSAHPGSCQATMSRITELVPRWWWGGGGIEPGVWHLWWKFPENRGFESRREQTDDCF